MREVVEIVALWILAPFVAYRFILWDEARLPPEQLEHAWPRKTRTAAVVGISLALWPWASMVALIVHFGRTRRSVDGVARGAAWAVLFFGVILLLIVGIDELPDSPIADWTVLGLAVALGLHEAVTTWQPWKA